MRYKPIGHDGRWFSEKCFPLTAGQRFKALNAAQYGEIKHLNSNSDKMGSY